jgi:hypothetical protein
MLGPQPVKAMKLVGCQTQKRPRAEVRGSVAFVELCAAEPIPAQSAPSLAQVRAPGERCRLGAYLVQTYSRESKSLIA